MFPSALVYFLTVIQHLSLNRLTGEGTYETTSSSKVVYAQKEALIVSELKQYVIAADPQVRFSSNLEIAMN